MHMKNILRIALAAALPLAVCAQEVKIEKPASRQATSFAIVIDDKTYEKCAEEVNLYRRALEKDGLSTWVLSARWENPGQLRGELEKLYGKQPNLEGIVLIGDIPVVLVRNAQHMTTAFKMDEERFPKEDASVTSDRFYDDLHLKFDYLEQDTVNPRHFYYKLADDSPQRLNPTYYSGRIMYPPKKGGDPYAAIGKFLRKAVAEKERTKQIDHIVTFAGDAYNSDCLNVWLDEKLAVNENFPLTGRDHLSAMHLNFRMDEFMKFRLFDQLQRDELDVMLFNEHGSIHLQHINGNTPGNSTENRMKLIKSEVDYYVNREADKEEGDPEGAKQHFMKELGLLPSFFEEPKKEDAGKAAEAPVETVPGLSANHRDNITITLDDLEKVKTMPRFVMFNACYNGSFQRPGCIAAYYIFNDGRTVATQGNTVNVLQDRWTYEMVGLLSHGVRVGQYNRLIATLEGHIVGDPTFRFKPVEPNTLSSDMTALRGKTKVWERYLGSDYADIRSVALRTMADGKKPMPSARLLEIMKECPFATTRMECLKLLSRYDNADFIEAIRLGLRDPYELLRRNAANYAWMTGDPSLIPDIVDVYLNDPESQRVAYTLEKAMALLPSDQVTEAMNRAVDRSLWPDKEAKRKEMADMIASSAGVKEKCVARIMDRKAKEEARKMAIRTVRNYTYHEYADDFLKFVADRENSTRLRVIMAEALGWFTHSRKAPDIVEGCRRILAEEKDMAPELRGELTQTIIRLQ